MDGPHMTGSTPVTSRKISARTLPSSRRLAGVAASMKSSTDASVGWVLFSAMPHYRPAIRSRRVRQTSGCPEAPEGHLHDVVGELVCTDRPLRVEPFHDRVDHAEQQSRGRSGIDV